jgi:hypothetical protein
MRNIIEELIKDIYDGLQRKLAYVWPKRGGYFPPEANLLFEIAGLVKVQVFFVW